MKNKKVGSAGMTALLVFIVVALFVSLGFKGVMMPELLKVGLFPQSNPNEGSNERDDRVLFENKDGEVIHLASLKGKVVFINFWATWCPPCIAEMPSIQKLYSNFAENEDVIFVMLDVDNNREKSQRFMDRKKFNLPVYTPVSAIPADYMSGAIPTTLVLNKYGRVVFKHEGMGDFSSAEFKGFIDQLIAE